MKYFTSDPSGEHGLGGVTNARKYLLDHPEATAVYRHWWSGCDLIDVETVSRERLFTQKASKLNAGATAQWAQPRGLFRSETL